MHLKRLLLCGSVFFAHYKQYSHVFAKDPLALQFNMCRELREMSSEMISVAGSLLEEKESDFNST